jgi:subtilase family serine protease
MQNIKFYSVMGHSDTTEGRGPLIVAARFSNEMSAIKFYQSNEYLRWCVMGYRGNVSPSIYVREDSITIFDSYDECQAEKIELEKKKALDKLTDREKKLLGL